MRIVKELMEIWLNEVCNTKNDKLRAEVKWYVEEYDTY